MNGPFQDWPPKIIVIISIRECKLAACLPHCPYTGLEAPPVAAALDEVTAEDVFVTSVLVMVALVDVLELLINEVMEDAVPV